MVSCSLSMYSEKVRGRLQLLCGQLCHSLSIYSEKVRACMAPVQGLTMMHSIHNLRRSCYTLNPSSDWVLFYHILLAFLLFFKICHNIFYFKHGAQPDLDPHHNAGFRSRSWSRREPGYLAGAGTVTLTRLRLHLEYLFNNSRK